jgi:hypothetical protein
VKNTLEKKLDQLKVGDNAACEGEWSENEEIWVYFSDYWKKKFTRLNL